jgi:hypothetical protein
MSINVEAVFSLYPSVVTVSGNDEDLVAYDASYTPILVSIPDILVEEQRLEAEAQADAEAREALRQSLIAKLAATLTPEETALLEELL